MTNHTKHDRPQMSDDLLKARRIYKSLDTDPAFTLARARVAYRESFGVAHDAESIGVEYEELVREHFGRPRLYSWCAEAIPVPARIALALVLRERSTGRKRGHQRGSLSFRIEAGAQMEEVQELKAKYTNGGDNVAEAEWKATNEVYRTWVYQGQRRSLLSVEQMFERLRHPGRYGLEMKKARRVKPGL